MATTTHTVYRAGRELQVQPPATRRAHPRIYAILIALTLWFIAAAWSFAGAGITNYLLFIVSGFLCVALALPLILMRVGRAHRAVQSASQPPLRKWVRCDYDTWTGRLSGANAATQILLPIAAAAIGMTAIGIAYRLTGG